MKRPRKHSRRRETPWQLLALVLACTALLSLLPIAITGRMNNLLEVLAPFQAAATGVVGTADSALHPKDTDRDTARRIQALESTVVTLSAQNKALQSENATLAGIRGRGLGARGRLIPARIIAHDSANWRESRRLLAGTRRGVTGGDGVISLHFSQDLPEAAGMTSGMAVLASEVLVGVIVQTGSYTSQMRLLSDPATRMSVTVGRVEESTFTTAGAAFWLVGRGKGRIEIRDVHHQYITDGVIKIGDSVLTRPDEILLPPSVTIGSITGIDPDPDNGLLFTLQVDPEIDMTDLRRVFVVDTGQ